MNSKVQSAAFLVALLFCTNADASPSSCPENFFEGQAPNLVDSRLATKSREICYSEYAILHSGLTRTPLYSADHLTSLRVSAAEQQLRSDSSETFHEEVSLPVDERSWLRDYSRSGYDRGHMTPNGDFDNAKAQGESFTLANMIPQDPNNNRGLWMHLEAATRALAQKYGDVWVVTVPIFAGAQTQWLHNRVAIPTKIAKAVYVPALKGAAAYLVDNAPGDVWQSISIAQLRDLSNIDVFPALPEDMKRQIIQLPAPVDRRSRWSGF